MKPARRERTPGAESLPKSEVILCRMLRQVVGACHLDGAWRLRWGDAAAPPVGESPVEHRPQLVEVRPAVGNVVFGRQSLREVFLVVADEARAVLLVIGPREGVAFRVQVVVGELAVADGEEILARRQLARAQAPEFLGGVDDVMVAAEVGEQRPGEIDANVRRARLGLQAGGKVGAVVPARVVVRHSVSHSPTRRATSDSLVITGPWVVSISAR